MTEIHFIVFVFSFLTKIKLRHRRCLIKQEVEKTQSDKNKISCQCTIKKKNKKNSTGRVNIGEATSCESFCIHHFEIIKKTDYIHFQRFGSPCIYSIYIYIYTFRHNHSSDNDLIDLKSFSNDKRGHL